MTSVVWTVMLKELRELARDRRTLALIFLVPVALYPGLMIASEQLALVGVRQIESGAVTVGVQGDVPPSFQILLEANEGVNLVDGIPADPAAAVRDRSVGAVVSFSAPVAPAASPVAGARAPAITEGTFAAQVGITVSHDPTDDRSRRALEVLEELLSEWGEGILAGRIQSEGLPSDFAEPLAVTLESVAAPSDVGGWAMGRFLPVILVMVTLLGTFHSAVDAGAGERERGTMEALLTAPVARGQVVLGKFLAVAGVGIVAAALNLISLLVTFRTGLVRFGGAVDIELGVGPVQALAIFFALIPLAFLFGALFLGLSVRARSYREAQHSLMPVYLAAFVPALLPMFPGIELNVLLALVPVGGVSLVLRDYLTGDADLFLAVLAVGSTFVLSALALRFAARSFGAEEVIFGTDDRVHRSPEPSGPDLPDVGRRPTLAHALFFIGFLALAFFFVGVRLQAGLGETGLLLPSGSCSGPLHSPLSSADGSTSGPRFPSVRPVWSISWRACSSLRGAWPPRG